MVMTADAGSSCPHVEFDVYAKVNRFVDREPQQGEIPPADGFGVDLTVSCRDCHEPFVWVGPMAGFSPGEPRVSFNGTELRAPIRPRSAPVDFGLHRAGFHIEINEEGDGLG